MHLLLWASSVKVATCNFKGNLHGEWLRAEAELLDQEESIKLGYRLLHKKYHSMRILDFFSKLSGNYKKRQLIEFIQGLHTPDKRPNHRRFHRYNVRLFGLHAYAQHLVHDYLSSKYPTFVGHYPSH